MALQPQSRSAKTAESPWVPASLSPFQLQIVPLNLVTLLHIVLPSVARQSPVVIVYGYHFNNPLKLNEIRRHRGRQIHQYAMVFQRTVHPGRQNYRAHRMRCLPVINGVHQKIGGRGRPKARIKVLHLSRWCQDRQPGTPCYCFAQQAPHIFQFVGRTEMERDVSHLPATRLKRNSTNRGTGRPVAPFAPPLFHAVPAISR